MFKYVVIADDLTGANATCSLLKKLGMSVASLFQVEAGRNYDMDVIAYSTDSRGVSAKEAYDRVRTAAEKLARPDALYNKRIDSTLRGNIGAEIDGILDALPEKRTAIVVPAYPDSGRIVVNKTMLVNGVLLMDSDAGRDPKMPMKTNCVETIVGEQTKYRHAYITLEDVAKGADYLAEEIEKYAVYARSIVFDAVRNEDIITIARAVEKTGLPIVSVDPGPFTMYYAREKQIHDKTEQKILMVIGSVTDLTRQQVEYILQEKDIFFWQMNVQNFFAENTRQAEMEKAVKTICAAIDEKDLFMLTTTPKPGEKMLNLPEIGARLGCSVEEVSKILSDTLTETARRVLLETKKFDGIYSSGGDIAVSLLQRLGALGVDVRDEVMPLAVYGHLIEGELPNIKVVTKGGMVGGRDAILHCLNKMKNDL